MSGDSLWSTLTQFLWILPGFFVCLIGAVVISMRPMPKNAKMAAIASLLLTVITSLAAVGFNLYIHHVVAASDGFSSDSFRYSQIAYSILVNGFHLFALILMIVAVCIRGDTVNKPDNTNKVENPYTVP